MPETNTNLARLKLRTGETDEALLNDILESAKIAILDRRYPFHDYPTREVTVVRETAPADGEESNESSEEPETVTITETYVEDRYLDVQFRLALDMYNRSGAEGQLTHSENGIARTYGSEWMSQQILNEVIPWVGTL